MTTSSHRQLGARLITSRGPGGRTTVCFQQGRDGARLIIGSTLAAHGRIYPFSATGRALPPAATQSAAEIALLNQSVGLGCRIHAVRASTARQ